MRTPLLVVGDGPQEPTGLGRIARDLCGLIAESDLPVDLVQVGGTQPPVWRGGWPAYPLNPDNDDWGRAQVEAYYRDCFGDRPGVVWLIWDPARLVAYLRPTLPVQWWAYTAVDAENVHCGMSGPAGEAVRAFDRVLAYGRWGSQILRTARGRTVPYLPHGIMPATYQTPPTVEEADWVTQTLGPYRGTRWLLGAVATNQPRKDLGWFAQTLRALLDDGQTVYGWLHTDTLVKHQGQVGWALPQLILDLGLAHDLTITTGTLTDRQLALLYQACTVTLAPGLGEGFGYPIVESLASGTPVIHHTYGGGAELIPRSEWRVPVAAWRLDGLYALKRPVLTAVDGRNAVLRARQLRRDDPSLPAYCQGAVAHLAWPQLWPYWQQWIRRGLEGGR